MRISSWQRFFQLAALAIVVLAHTPLARAQQQGSSEWQRMPPIDIGATFTSEHSKTVAGDCGCFWTLGGSAEANIHVYRDISAAAILTGSRASDVIPGVDISQIAVMAGPRYTYKTSRWTDRLLGSQHRTAIFGEALFGGVHDIDGVYTSDTGLKSTATAMSMQFGGGLDIHLTRRFSIRAVEVDYIRTSLPNSTTDSQHTLRLAAGIAFHLR